MMFLSIDQFDGEYAVCQDDDEKLYEIKRSLLPPNSKPGDILKTDDCQIFIIDIEETQRRKNIILSLQRKLFK